MESNTLQAIPHMMVIGAIVVGAIMTERFRVEKARKMIFRQATQQGIEVIQAEHRYFGGPYWWRKGKAQIVFAVQKRTAGGGIQNGYAICGNMLLGTLIDEVTFDFPR